MNCLKPACYTSLDIVQGARPNFLRFSAEGNISPDVFSVNENDGIVCANDFTAAHLLKTLNELGVSVPAEIRMAGIDDVKYASLLSVPLTTIHQPCEAMGAIAISTMLERLRQPKLPARDILLNFHLEIRESCGVRKKEIDSRLLNR